MNTRRNLHAAASGIILLSAAFTGALADSKGRGAPPTARKQPPVNPMIDYPGFLKDAAEVGRIREERRLSEDEFLRMSAEPGTVVLDARSADKYRMLHIRGALHLALTDFTAEEIGRLIPDKSTRILIYCNNNFENEPIALQAKAMTASLNIYTVNTLYSYGYRNVYELGPLLDIHKTKLPMVGTLRR